MENYNVRIKTIDTHTMGEATRIVIDGFPEIVGETMMDKKNYVRDHYDDFRKLLMNEPRGHKDMFGAILTKPTHPKADIGVIFMDSGSYLNMCGHGTIGTVTMCLTKELIPKKDTVFIDTPAGLIECLITYKDQVVESVSFQNVSSFVLHKDTPIQLSNDQQVNVDVAFGGSFFGIVNAQDIGMEISLKNKNEMVRIAMEIREQLNTQLSIEHPFKPEINTVDLIEISEKVGPNHYRNVVIFGDGQIDRSPCGTGTCAKIATLNLKAGESIIQESIIGSTFKGTLVEHTKVAGMDAVIPEITGSAWITGEHLFVLQHHDVYETGFSI